MSRPPREVCDLSRSAGAAFIERNRQWLRWKHIKVLLAIARCRTAALGGHLDECPRCGHRATLSYNSGRNRHCPKCQTAARERWIAARQRELLPTRYMHVVFTLPSRLAPLVLQNKKVLYDLLFRTSAETLLEVARGPRLLGAEIGFFSVLHTWNQQLQLHPHLHIIIPAGGLSPDHTRWVRSRNKYFLPKKVLRRGFRGKTQASCEPQNLRCLATATVPKKLGGLFETSLRRSPIRAAISRPLHPSRGHLQPSPGFFHRWPGHLSLARFRPPQPTEVALATGRSVPEPLSAAPTSARLRADPALRFPGQPTTREVPPALLSPAGRITTASRRTHILHRRLSQSLSLP